MKGITFAVLALGAGILATTPGIAAGVAVETVTMEKSTTGYDINIAYPKTGVAAIDEEVAAFAQKEFDDFVALASGNEDDTSDMKYSLDIGFEVERNDAGGFGVLFTDSQYTGGAHPNSFFRSFNYIMPEGWRVDLPEIFNGKAALAKISALAIADLKRQGGLGEGDDGNWVTTGAGPDWNNFRDFILKAKTLELNFAAYEVASYAAGPQQVSIPLSQLKGLMRADWKQPVPSFDCRKAATAVELAICGDTALARLDLQVADNFRLALSNAETDADKATVRAGQTDWLATRDRQCAGGDVTCLSGVYGARLDALNPPD
jgi:uncharacterized protein YecT (DUF1311 family)